MLGIFGLINNVSAIETGIEDNTRGTRADPIEVPGFLRMVTGYSGYPHDGIYDDSDYYLGVEYGFNIYLKNIYNGDHLENVNTTLRTGSNVGSAIKITQPYYNDTYIWSNDVENFYYTIKIGTNANIALFDMYLEVDFVYVNDQYESYTITNERMSFKIQLTSRLRHSYGPDELQLQAKNNYGSIIPLYSGAKNQIITLDNLESAYGDLEDVDITLILPSSFTVDSTMASLDELQMYDYKDVEWSLTDAGATDAEAKEHYGNLQVRYTWNNEDITEKNVPVTLAIAETPILCLDGQIDEIDIGSTTGGTFNSNIEIYQGSTTQTFSLKFRNDGNMDLKDVEVELYTDNAAFFFKSNFYYDESSHAYKRAYGKTINFGDVSVGQSSTKDFSTEIIKNLPPGLYRIPIKYTAQYSPGGSAFVTIQEYNYHETIMAQRSTSNEGFTPFLLLHVLEGDDANDQTEPDLQAISSTKLKPGMHNVQLEVEITNMENYQLNNVNVKIEAGGTSPLQPLNEVDRTKVEVDAQEKEFTMYSASDTSFSNKFTVHFMVDVFKDASAGLHEVPITLTCLDPFNQERSTVVKVPLNVDPNPPYFVISDASTSKIQPNKKFDLNVKVYNCGGSDAQKVRLMFNGSSNLFSALESIQGPKSVTKNKEEIFTFEIKAGEIDPGKTYASSIYMSYEDELGNTYPFDESTEQTVTLRAEKPEPDTWTINEGLALVILGLLILISAVIFGILRARIAKKEKGVPVGPGPTPTIQPTQKPEPEKRSRFGRKREKEGKVFDMSKGQPPRQQYPPSRAPPPQQPPPQQPPPQQGYQQQAGWQAQGPQGAPPPQQEYSPYGGPPSQPPIGTGGQYQPPPPRGPQQDVYY